MKNLGELGFHGDADGSGQHKHHLNESVQVSSGQKRRKALPLNPKRAHTKRKRSITAFLKELKTNLKCVEKEKKSMKKIIESQAKEIKKLKKLCKKLKLGLADQRHGYDDQNDRMEEAVNQLTHILMRDVMALLRRESPSQSNAGGLAQINRIYVRR